MAYRLTTCLIYKKKGLRDFLKRLKNVKSIFLTKKIQKHYQLNNMFYDLILKFKYINQRFQNSKTYLKDKLLFKKTLS